MGRGRGKGKKPTVIATRNDPAGSGEEEKIPTYRKRGRPQKTSKDDMEEEEDEAVKIEVEDEDAKGSTTIKDLKNQSTAENGRKRKRAPQANENSEMVEEENGVGKKPNGNGSVKSVGFRQSSNRRKSKPRRAAEAGVLCN